MEPTQPEPSVEKDVTAAGQVEAGAHHELARVKAILRTHGLRTAIWIALALLIVVGGRVYRGHKAQAKVNASAMLMSARTVQDLEALVEQYASTPSAPLAMLKLAKAYYDFGNYDLAFNRYVDFLERYPEHEMRGIAELGKLHGLEARGQTREALDGFERFVAANPGHFLEAQAVFGKARCLEQAGRKEEARVVYEDFIAARPDSGWATRAEEMLKTMDQRTAFQAPSMEWSAPGAVESLPSLPSWGESAAATAAPPAGTTVDQPATN
jgi:tetratricopeptide (TPR) repeat protein